MGFFLSNLQVKQKLAANFIYMNSSGKVSPIHTLKFIEQVIYTQEGIIVLYDLGIICFLVFFLFGFLSWDSSFLSVWAATKEFSNRWLPQVQTA